jgi:PadR family transcriptional regulator, regulatory protein PadR
LLRALEAEGLVSSQWEAESGPPRRVYQLTASGADLLDSWAGSLHDMRASIERFLAIYDARRGSR